MLRRISKSLTCWAFRCESDLLRRRKQEEKPKSRLDVTVVGFLFLFFAVCVCVYMYERVGCGGRDGVCTSSI